jgi:spore maturation protein CgeB
MRIAMFYHSLVSDWNHGNAHFLRGVVTELLSRGHKVTVYEPADGWSLNNLLREQGEGVLEGFRLAFPGLESVRYILGSLDLQAELDGADLVIVHEWNDPQLVWQLGRHRARGAGWRLLFHDTHHRSVTESHAIPAGALACYDGVLAYGAVIRDRYISQGWIRRAWTWHEAADTRVFHPIEETETEGDLVWIGNWGDGERDAELREFLLGPVNKVNVQARVYGVRYPAEVLGELNRAGIRYGGWLPNYRVPEIFSRFRMTVHIPRRPYAQSLPGIPTIRVFEALACGIPLACAPWDDIEGLFTPGTDYLMARDPAEMTRCITVLLQDRAMARQLAVHGHRTILARHTCAHRVDELLEIYGELNTSRRAEQPVGAADNVCGRGVYQRLAPRRWARGNSMIAPASAGGWASAHTR